MSKLPTKRREVKGQLWKTNPTMEMDFIAYCTKSATLHGYKGSSLKSWISVVTQMNAKYEPDGHFFDQKVLKNKWTSLRNGYLLWRPLTLKTGHGRNGDGTFNWSDETWDAEIKLCPTVARFRLEPLKHHKELEKLFEGTFASGDEQYNPTLDDTEELEDDAMNVNVEDEGDHVVDIESDAYFSNSARESSPGHGSTPDPNNSARESSPGQGSTPVPNKVLGSSQRKGKRKSQSLENDDVLDITEVLKSHITTTQQDREMLRRKIDMEEEMMKKKMERDDAKAKKSDAYSMEECCKLINGMRDIPELNVEKHFFPRPR